MTGAPIVVGPTSIKGLQLLEIAPRALQQGHHASPLTAEPTAVRRMRQSIEELGQRCGVVAMVGDGVNDAPALARANLGIAMGAIGSDAAIETADIALMSDDVSKLPSLIRHAKSTLAIIRQNIVFSLGVKAVFVVLTFVGFASLRGAIAADMGASLAVVANSLRLLSAGSERTAGWADRSDRQ